MADGYHYTPGNQFYFHHTPKNSLPSDLLVNPLGQFLRDPPSPSKSPDPGSRGHSAHGMYNQSHQQGHNSRINGNQSGRMPPIYPSYGAGGHPHQGQSHQHHILQSEHSLHSGNASGLSHHSAFSSGVLSSASPFNANGLSNGHSVSQRLGGGPPPPEHWTDQQRAHKDSETAHSAMVEQNQANYYARMKANENKGIGMPSPGQNPSNPHDDGETEDLRRPTATDKPAKRQDWHNLDLSGQGLRALSSPLFLYKFLQELYIASNKLIALPPAIGELRQLRHLEASNNQISVLPAELGMCTFMKQLLLFNNNIQTLPHAIGSLSQLEMLGIEGNPLDMELKKEIMENGTKSLITMLREGTPIPPPPTERKMIVVQEDVSPTLERVKVFTWNILCDRYATTQVYGYTPSAALSWDYRRDLIMKEIRARDADFLCLQEVNTDAQRETFGPELAKMDYKSIHYPRSKARLMSDKEATIVDGCAIFYKQSKFILLDKTLVDFQNIAINRPDMKTQVDIFNRVMPKDNIAIVALFESRQTGARMIVVNTHLVWEGTLADVKIIQTALLMELVTKQAEKYTRFPPCKDKKIVELASLENDEPEGGRKELPEPQPSQEYRANTDIPVFVCGDYNSTKDSGVYDLLSNGRLPPNHPELGKYQYGNFTQHGIEHPFSLRSAYDHLDGTPDELPFTNYTPGFANVIDYIWYTTNTLEVVELLGPPDAEFLKRMPGFPNYHFPADHIQIMAEFVIKARKDLRKGGAS